MAKNVTINGQNYSAVPSVQIPITGGGTASFVDISDTTATASDVNSGKYLYLANGTKTQGSQTVYSISKSLTKVTASNSAGKVIGGGYYTKLTSDSGYFISSVSVTMGGTDITNQAFSGTGEGFSVTTNLTHFYIANAVSTKTSFRAELVKEPGIVSTNDQITIIMGGVDVSSYYSSGVINIPNVTGDIVITATATAATISSISATFIQGQNVIYDTDSLEELRQYLTVTATYTGGATATVTEYSLSGTLTAGTSTITVSYSGKTTTFNVTVTSYKNRMSYAYSRGELTKISAANNYSNNQLKLDYSYSGKRRVFAIEVGDKPYLNYSSSQDTGYYPIPIPSNATSVTVSITPNTQYVGVGTYTLSNNVYSWQAESGWQQGSTTMNFTAGSVQYLSINCKYNSSGSSYPTEPSELTITFS